MTTIKGFKRMQGVSKKTGGKYDGYILYCEDDYVPEDVKGVLCYEKFVGSTSLQGDPYVGAQVIFHFDHNGRLTGCEVL